MQVNFSDSELESTKMSPAKQNKPNQTKQQQNNEVPLKELQGIS